MPAKKGFAAMTPEKQREIASKGGKSLSIEVRREIGRKGGMARAEKLRRNLLLSTMQKEQQQREEQQRVHTPQEIIEPVNTLEIPGSSQPQEQIATTSIQQRVKA